MDGVGAMQLVVGVGDGVGSYMFSSLFLHLRMVVSEAFLVLLFSEKAPVKSKVLGKTGIDTDT